jgi:hypothetical protein
MADMPALAGIREPWVEVHRNRLAVELIDKQPVTQRFGQDDLIGIRAVAGIPLLLRHAHPHAHFPLGLLNPAARVGVAAAD